MKWKAQRSAAENARTVLPKLVQEYFESGRKASKKKSPKALHRFRIATKRFRYSLELFRPIYGAQLDRRLKALHDLQDSLGAISDFQTLQGLLGGNPALESRLEKELAREIRAFHRLWRAFDSQGQLKRWKAELRRTI